MSNYRKAVVVSKYQKGLAQFQHAKKASLNELGESIPLYTKNDAEKAVEVFNKYLAPYLKVKKVEKGKFGAFAYLEDGTALYLKFEDYTYTAMCLTHKACKNLDETSAYRNMENGKDIFGADLPSWHLQNSNRAQRLYNCKNHLGLGPCGGLIFEAGWKIPDDYPIKL